MTFTCPSTRDELSSDRGIIEPNMELIAMATIDTDLINRYVEPDSPRWGAAGARLHESGVEVWVLVAQLPALDGDVGQLAVAYGLPRDAVEAALAYYRRHKDVIDARIALNGA